ncbi:DUF6082 family protein [Streptomyces sp. NPDC051569]|uniref:DUF6082 family protein n=1 Tax=Streptomyces sp. NPDC051569 TaxID=3365661 RepID=UPI0037BCCB07
MKKKMLVATLLAAAAVGVACLAVTSRQHRERCLLATAAMHQRLMADQERDATLAAMSPALDSCTEEQRVHTLHCNRWMVLWTSQFRTRVVAPGAMHGVAVDFMANPRNAEFWKKARKVRIAEARDSTDREFVEIFEQAYRATFRSPDCTNLSS